MSDLMIQSLVLPGTGADKQFLPGTDAPSFWFILQDQHCLPSRLSFQESTAATGPSVIVSFVKT